MKAGGSKQRWAFVLLAATVLFIVFRRADAILLAVLPTELELHAQFDCLVAENKFGTNVHLRDDDTTCTYSRALIESAAIGGYSVRSDEALIIIRSERADKLFNEPGFLDPVPTEMIDECLSELELAIYDIERLAITSSASDETTEDGLHRLICTRRAFI
ncbi:MAG: hypothetical protein ACRC6I_05740 [Paracoccaceae bacterium]